MTRLLLATNNPGKRRELRALFGDLHVQLLAPHALALSMQVREAGTTYAENARRKAWAFAQASGLWSLADDSGLEVEALDGAPGPYSARLAGPSASDADRRLRLLALLQPYPRPWQAEFRCAMALANPDGDIEITEGLCRGEIIPEPRGSGGFGYDPIFLVQGMGQTMAELDEDEKNRISHRARAAHAMRPILQHLLGLS